MIDSKMVFLGVAGLLTAAAGTWLVEALYYYFTQYSYSMLADGQANFRIPYEFFYLALFSWALLFRWSVSRPRILFASSVVLLVSLLPVTAIVVTAYVHSTLPLSRIWERIQGAYMALIVAQFIVLVLMNLLFWLVKKPASKLLLEGAAS